MTSNSLPPSYLAIPEISDRQYQLLRSRGRLPRRNMLVRTAQVGLGLGIGYVALISRATPAMAANDGNYFRDFTSETSGPCGPGGYAQNHSEEGRKCGPSMVCGGLQCCHEPSSGTPGPDTKANTVNARSWHRWTTNGVYMQRPDDCWSGSPSDYDSWRWRFRDGTIYSCSDGLTCRVGGTQCVNSICPWPRAG